MVAARMVNLGEVGFPVRFSDEIPATFAGEEKLRE